MDDLELVVTHQVETKIKLKHGVDLIEVEEALFNFNGSPLIDDREENRTRPPTIWFISFTTDGRLLKIIGIPMRDRKEFVLKTAYEPDLNEVELYEENQ